MQVKILLYFFICQVFYILIYRLPFCVTMYTSHKL